MRALAVTRRRSCSVQCMSGVCLRMWGSMRRFMGTFQCSLGRMHRGCDVAPMQLCLVQRAQARPPCSKTQRVQAEIQQELYHVTNVEWRHEELFLDPTNTS